MIDRVSLSSQALTLAEPLSLPHRHGVHKEPEGFAAVLREQLEAVNRLQLEAEQQAQRLARGEAESLHDVMIAAAKAQLALDLTVAIRNKVLEAYQEISRMQL